MSRQSKLFFLLLSVMLLCTLICGLYFFEKDSNTSAQSLIPCAAVLSEDGSRIIFTDSNGTQITQINTEGMIFSESERESLLRGITARSEDELMSMVEDYID